MKKSADLATKKVKAAPGQRVPISLLVFRDVYNSHRMQSAADVAKALQEKCPNIEVSANWVRAYATRYSKVENSGILKPVDRFSPEGIVAAANRASSAAKETAAS